MKNSTMTELLKREIFSSLESHDVQNHNPFEDRHSSQITKAIVNEFFSIRLLRYGQTFTEEDNSVNSNIGKRQQYTKLILFEGL